jgi:hypothetical protein
MIAAPRYNDSFVKTNGEWLFAERLLYVEGSRIALWLESAIL